MHIKTRLDLIMDALQASKLALESCTADYDRDICAGKPMLLATANKASRALGKIDVAFDAGKGTEERP